MDLNNIKKFLPKRLETLLTVKESKLGIETYMHNDLDKLGTPYKKQLKAFLEEVIRLMGK